MKRSAGFKAAPIGSFRKNSCGYTMIKVSNKGKTAERWRPYHRYLWEKHYGRKLPKGMILIFLDGNKNNFDIKNIAAITRAESLYLTDYHLWFEDAELSKAGTLIAKVAVKAKEKSRDVKKKVIIYMDNGQTAVLHDCTLKKFMDSFKKNHFEQFMITSQAMINMNHVVNVVEQANDD
ncbi:HNH endonuclease signature motif containing protein [Limosilactobacillus avium]|uniref:HNH endonuclease signature motif containing protein n=1 Tax=Limosilactobacillus avium TaxID=2991831 RepID=UPI0024BB1099|nr:HNH endonuclease signature motif containing protein [Limosilactobacillus avium]